MPRSQGRPKKSSKATKVRQKTRKKVPGAAPFFDRSKLSYDTKATQFENYKRIGLLADANQIGAERQTLRGFKPRVKGPVAAPADDADAPHPLELEVPPPLITYRQVPEGERKVLQALVKQYGDDHARMARDMRINTHQHTAAHLRRRIAKMVAEDEEDAARAAEALEAGAPAPPPRLQRKVTFDPNPQFKNKLKKRSLQFN